MCERMSSTTGVMMVILVSVRAGEDLQGGGDDGDVGLGQSKGPVGAG